MEALWKQVSNIMQKVVSPPPPFPSSSPRIDCCGPRPVVCVVLPVFELTAAWCSTCLRMIVVYNVHVRRKMLTQITKNIFFATFRTPEKYDTCYFAIPICSCHTLLSFFFDIDGHSYHGRNQGHSYHGRNQGHSYHGRNQGHFYHGLNQDVFQSGQAGRLNEKH